MCVHLIKIYAYDTVDWTFWPQVSNDGVVNLIGKLSLQMERKINKSMHVFLDCISYEVHFFATKKKKKQLDESLTS